MSGPEPPYKISSSEDLIACLRKITKFIDALRDNFRLGLNDMCLHLKKLHKRNQTMLQNLKLQMQPQEVPVSDFSIF